MDTELKRRDLGMYALLMVVTLGLYEFYLIPKLGLSVNQLVKKEEYKFNQVLLVGIFTLGIGLVVFEILYAYSLEKSPGYTQEKWSNRNIGGYVLVLNILAVVLAFLSGGLAFVISCALGCWATWLIQNQVNKHLESCEQEHASDSVKAAPSPSA
ncbi:MAG: DUF4234 domain-containing protein [Zetaproteobacteria bacterium]|nr:DUF4234 domain-containing protein [Zetaproteobacteria bacterium]